VNLYSALRENTSNALWRRSLAHRSYIRLKTGSLGFIVTWAVSLKGL